MRPFWALSSSLLRIVESLCVLNCDVKGGKTLLLPHDCFDRMHSSNLMFLNTCKPQ